MYLLVSIFCLVLSEPLSFGIVGAGIGGASCSYHLKKLFPDATITVYDRNDYIGGRLKHFEIDGAPYELGGDAWASPNLAMLELAREMGIPISVGKKRYTLQDSNPGVWLGNGKWKFINGSIDADALKFGIAMSTMLYEIFDNYGTRQNKTFSDVKSFFQPYDLSIGVSYKDYIANMGVSDNFRDINMIPFIRAIYDQELNVNAFGGMVSMIPLVTPGYSVDAGNSVLVEKLFESTKAFVHLKSTVTTIISQQQEKKYQILTKEGKSSIHDAVFFATPFEFANISFQVPDFPVVVPRRYRHWYVTFFVADGLNPKYFGIDPVPQNILTTTGGDQLPFVVLSLRGQTKQGKQIYKTFSNSPLGSVEIGLMFLNLVETKEQYWPKTFPLLDPTNQYQPLKFGKNLYYLNALESTATAMETSAVSGKNAAYLYFQSR